MTTLSLDMLPEGDIVTAIFLPLRAATPAGKNKKHAPSAAEHLNPEDRAAIIMSYWYDLSDHEIGEALKLSSQRRKSRLFRARRELARMWQAEQPRPP